MHWHYAAAFTAAHDQVTATLAHFLEAKFPSTLRYSLPLEHFK
jgi:hypothetical protein